MADLHAGLDVRGAGPQASHEEATEVSALFRARYSELVRLADLLGADDPEDITQEAFARLIRKHGSLRDPSAAQRTTPRARSSPWYTSGPRPPPDRSRGRRQDRAGTPAPVASIRNAASSPWSRRIWYG